MIIYVGNDGSNYWRSTELVRVVENVRGDKTATFSEVDAESLRVWLNARKAEEAP